MSRWIVLRVTPRWAASVEQFGSSPLRISAWISKIRCIGRRVFPSRGVEAAPFEVAGWVALRVRGFIQSIRARHEPYRNQKNAESLIFFEGNPAVDPPLVVKSEKLKS
jgi:hypothetical protein